MFEELLEAGFSDAEYDAWQIRIFAGDQFWSGFVDLNPNSKIPALLDRSGREPFRVFESGSILVHLAEKFDYLLPKTQPARAETLSWLMWQMGSAPLIGGGLGHFYVYAPERYKYPIDRYAMETKRLYDVADRQLAKTEYLAGDDYTIAEICERHNTNKTAIRKAVIRFGWRPRAPRRIDRGDAIERLFRLLERQIKQLEIGGPVEGKDAAGTLVRLVNTLAKLTALRAAEIARRHREAAKPGISDIKVKLIERIEQLKRS